MDLYIQCESPEIYKIYSHYNNELYNKSWLPLTCVKEQVINPNQNSTIDLGIRCVLKKIRTNIKNTTENHSCELFSIVSFWVLTNEDMNKLPLICQSCPFPVDKNDKFNINLSILNLGSARVVIKKGYQFFRITTPTLETIRKIYVSLSVSSPNNSSSG